MQANVFFRNAVSAHFSEPELKAMHSALFRSLHLVKNHDSMGNRYAPHDRELEQKVFLSIDTTLKRMRRFRRRYELKETTKPQPKTLDRELFPKWIS